MRVRNSGVGHVTGLPGCTSPRLVDYFVVVSYGDALEAIDPSELSGSLMESAGGAASLAGTVAVLGGAGGTVDADPEVSITTNSCSTTSAGHRELSPTSYAGLGTALSPIAASPVVTDLTYPAGETPMSPALPLSPHNCSTAATGAPDSNSNGGGLGVVSRSSTSGLSPISSNDSASPMPPSPAIASPHQKAAAAAAAAGVTVADSGSASPPAAIAAQFALPNSPLSANSPHAATAGGEHPHVLVAASGTCQGLSVLLSPQHHKATSPVNSSTAAGGGPAATTLLSPQSQSGLPMSPLTSPPTGMLHHPNLSLIVRSPMGSSSASPMATGGAPSTSGGGGSGPFTPRTLQSFTERTYRGHIVDRYPQRDHRSVPFPPGIAMFCMPEDLKLTLSPAPPTNYFFAATGANGVRLYGACLHFYEPLPPAITEQVWREERVVQENKKRMAQALALLNAGGFAASYGSSIALNTPQYRPEASSLAASSPSLSSGGGSASSPAASSHSTNGTAASTSPPAVTAPTPKTAAQAAQHAADAAMYAHCLQEPHKRPIIYASKCICLLSTHTFLRQFRSFLTGLYRISLTPSPVPLERFLCNFMGEVPLPPMGEIKVEYHSLMQQEGGGRGGGHAAGGGGSSGPPSAGPLVFARPPPNNPFGFHHFPIRLLFEYLDFAHVLLLYECLLCERRILLLSEQLSTLTLVSEALLALMYPFHWSHVYIPLLPRSLLDFLHAPMPFLIGTRASYLGATPGTFLRGDVLDELVIVDLDRNVIDMPGVSTRKPPPLPHREKKKLWRKLKALNLFAGHGQTHHSASSERQHQLQSMDLAFSNAPLPTEVSERGGAGTNGAARSSLSPLASAATASSSSSSSSGTAPHSHSSSSSSSSLFPPGHVPNLAHLLAVEVNKNMNIAASSSSSSSSSTPTPPSSASSSAEKKRNNSVSGITSSITPNFSSGLYASGAGGSAGGVGQHSRNQRSGSVSAAALTSPSALSGGHHPARSGSFSSPSGRGGAGQPSSPSFSSSSSSSAPSPSSASSPLYLPSLLHESSTSASIVDYLICSAFFRVHVSMLKDYRPYLIFPTASNPLPDPCFDLPGFLKGHEHANRGNFAGMVSGASFSSASSGLGEFMEEFTTTQAWRRFCEERTFPAATGAGGANAAKEAKHVLFFDESILAKRNRSKFLSKRFDTPFLRDRSGEISKTFVAPWPDTSNLPTAGGGASMHSPSFVYPCFPHQLDPKLFVKPRIITPLLIKQHQHPQQHLRRTGSGSNASSGWTSKEQEEKGGGGGGGGLISALANFSASRRRGGGWGAAPASGVKDQPIGGGAGGGEQVVATLWFLLFTSILGENGPSPTSSSSLDSLFQVLVNLRNNGLVPEESVYPALMFACGACGLPERALDVLREMANSGHQPDSNTYAALLQVFTMQGDHRGQEALAKLKGGNSTNGSGKGGNPTSPATGASLVSSLRERLKSNKGSAALHTPAATTASSTSASSPTYLDSSGGVGHPTYYHHPYDPSNPSSPHPTSPLPLRITEIADVDRIRMFALQFELMFPSLTLSTEETCPECNQPVHDHEVRAGWTANSNDYTTRCPHPGCGERFVARFTVKSKAWTKAQQQGEMDTAKAQQASTTAANTQPQTSASNGDVSNCVTPPQPGAHTSLVPSPSPSPDLAVLVPRGKTREELLALSPDSLAMYRATHTLLAAQAQEQGQGEDGRRDVAPFNFARADSSDSPAHSNTAFQPHMLVMNRSDASDTVHIPAAPSSAPAPSPPIMCEYLSPRVLKKEVIHLLEVRPARYFCTRAFRKNSSVLFWNLVWHFTNQCLPIDFLLRREPKPKQSATTPGSARGVPKSRRRRQRPTPSASPFSTSSMQSQSSVASRSTSQAVGSLASAPLDDFERAVATARITGVGRAFGYGTGGMVSGAGAVGISLGQMMRTRDPTLLAAAMQPLPASALTALDDEEEECEDDDDDNDEEVEEDADEEDDATAPADAAAGAAAASSSSPVAQVTASDDETADHEAQLAHTETSSSVAAAHA